VGAIVYNQEVSAELEDQFDRYLNDSRLIVSRTWEKRTLRQKVFEALTRLLSPLL